MWNKQAEIVAQHLAKGRQVMVVGEVEEARAFTDKQGNSRATLEVTAKTVRFLGQRGAGGGDPTDSVNVEEANPMPPF